MLSFDKIPSWPIVALVSRVARHLQELARECDRVVVEGAICSAETSARLGYIDERASHLSAQARRTSEEAERDGQRRASLAALCAAEAAAAACSPANKQGLIEAAKRALKCARDLGRPECYRSLEAEIERIARLGEGLADDACAPSEMLNVVYQQAIHEAGHAVAAQQLGILFAEVRIIYNAEVDFLRNPCEPSDSDEDASDFSAQDRADYCVVYAAGAGAEDLVFGTRREWAAKRDRHCHAQSGGTDFDNDARKACQIPGFSRNNLIAVASALENTHCLSFDDVADILKEQGISAPNGTT